ncbi:Holliday junction branch migration protein RuvA [Brucepastera parasyntrophica]|uniref:Holliday junction branch migration protein RuvA n=1 Tax=Brucepastera parasyntrophica TaxID=2880008 RepID=UPI002109A79A|nr:Holliday junction branch migration protein RuvA [Brucepastera parasyntrophica]ULQ60098.1 Holliday junction branch migration protein RuvA [Brucepastera parasyntrophica]
MFNSISGIITAKTPASVFLENNGIEWDIMVPALAIDSFGAVGAEVRVYTWLYHKEDSMRLFGFFSPAQRDLFLNLMKVEGIGPKQAVKILSHISVNAFEEAVDGEDLAQLERVPGIGKKTAQKMILALKGNLVRDNQGALHIKTGISKYEDIINALVEMGYERKASVYAVENAATEVIAKAKSSSGGPDPEKDPAGFEKEVFRIAIVSLS